MTEMTKSFPPPRSSPRPRFILFTHFSNTNKAKTTLVYPNYWPTKIEYFDSASLRLYDQSRGTETYLLKFTFCAIVDVKIENRPSKFYSLIA